MSAIVARLDDLRCKCTIVLCTRRHMQCLVKYTYSPRPSCSMHRKTSDLIPLCHPLPLDQVKIDISLDPQTYTITIQCQCRVTHKTGVEMEALTGASVAALVIYDMVKAMSHEVVIKETKLVSKTGGKRTIEHGKEQK
jgi:MoaC family